MASSNKLCSVLPLLLLFLQIPLLVSGCSDDECSANKDKCADVSPLCARVSALCDNIFFAQWKEMRCACPKTCGLCTGPMVTVPAVIPEVVQQAPAKCNATTHPLDVVLILDGSGSITYSDFDTQLSFAKQIARDLAVSSKGHRLGLVQYSSSAQTEIALGQYNETDDLENAIDKIDYMNGDSTMTGEAITWAMQKVFEFSSGSGVLTASKACIVVTDGVSEGSVKGPADKMRQKGVHMIAVGVGDNANRMELNEIADDPSHEYTVDNFRALNSTLAELLNKKICQDAFISP